jgi:hypothetical protein
MNKLLFMPLLLVFLTPVAFAEEVTVQVPFESHGMSCVLEDLVYTCTWEGVRDILTLEELEEFKDVLTEEQYEEAVEELTPIEPVKVDPPTYEERIIEQIEERIEKGKETRADRDILEALKNLNECRRGLGNSAPIQTEGSWEAPLLKPDTYGESFDYSKNYLLGKVVKAYEECVAQYKLENKVLSDKYGNLVVDGDFQPYHADMRTTDYNYPYVPEQHNMQPALCKALQHHGNAQYDYGCKIKPIVIMGYVEYTHPIYEAYAKYQNGDDSEQLRKNIQKSLDEKSKVYRNYGGQN